MKRLLIVDDEPGVRSVVVAMLATLNVETRQASDGREALRILQDWSADLLITDIYMPNMNGLELIDQVRSLYPRMPIIVLSGYVTETTREILAALGVRRIVHKGDEIAALVDLARQALSQEEGDDTSADIQRTKVLVVDDHTGFRELIVDTFEDLGYQVDQARNGVEACQRVSTGQFDLIFMDIHMPEMDGIRAIEKIRENDPHIFIVSMTGEADAREKAGACLAGAYTCLPKPFGLEELKQIAKKMERIAHHRRDARDREREWKEKQAASQTWVDRFRARHSVLGRHPIQRLAGMAFACVLLGILTVSIGQWTSSIYEKVASEFSDSTGFFARVEGYLKRDETRDLQRQNQ